MANCKGCGNPLLEENAWMVDGCPCNSPLGVNQDNPTRWELLHRLQQQQHTELTNLKTEHRQALARIKELEEGIRKHRDSSGHNCCWYHPELWGLLPDKIEPNPVIPEPLEFLERCIQYRRSLDPHKEPQ